MTSNILADTLDENLFSDKYFKKIYIFYAYWAILAPILTLFFYAVDFAIEIYYQHCFIAFLFVCTKAIELCFNFRNIRFRKLKIVDILLIALFCWFIVVTLITKTIN